jgi:TRAP-type mannitol/chloroaromatic compound transport system permease large subunit
LLGGQ